MTCSWMAITGGQGQLGAHLTSTILRFISEQEQGVVLISNKSFQVCEKVFPSKAAPAFFPPECHPWHSFSGLNMESLIKCYIGFYFYVLIYNRNLYSFLYRKPQNLGYYLCILLNGTYTDRVLSTALLAPVVGKPTVTKQ